MPVEIIVYDTLRMLLYAWFGLTFGLSLFGSVALWRFFNTQTLVTGAYDWDEDDKAAAAKRRPVTFR